MIVLACGDRNWSDVAAVERALEHLRTNRPEPLTVVEGGARGADRAAGQWAARMRAQGVGWLRVPAEWEKYGKRAGPIRNQAMLDYVLQGREMGQTVGVLAFHDNIGASKGTWDMVNRAQKAGVPVKLIGDSISDGCRSRFAGVDSAVHECPVFRATGRRGHDPEESDLHHGPHGRG